MTADQKVTLVEDAKNAYGLNLALAAIDLPKSTWYYHQKHKMAYEEKYADLHPILEEIARERPEYGVRRIMPELRDEYHIGANHKVVERLLGI
jgi:putative transposase